MHPATKVDPEQAAKKADQNHFRTIQSLQSSGQRGSPRSHLTKRLVREQKWSWEKVKWRTIPPLSLHQGEAARKLRPPRPWPPMHLAALCTVRCADRPLQYRLWLPTNTYLPSVQYLTCSSVQYLTSSSVKYLICSSVLYLICPRVQYLARTRGAWGAAQVQRTKRLYPIRGDEDGWYRDDGGW